MPNWAIAQQPSAFDRAFQQGWQTGDAMRQRREQEDQQNALAAYANNPTPEALSPLAQFAPQFVIQERERLRAADQAAQASGQQGVVNFRPVLEQVQANPALWGQARAAAIQSGIDARYIPVTYDQNWVQGQLIFSQAEEDGSLPGIVQELQLSGIDVATPEGQQVLRNVIEGRYSTEYTDETGAVRRRSPFSLPAVGGQPAAPAMPAPQAQTGAPDGNYAVPVNDAQRMIASLGVPGFLAWSNNNNIPVRIGDNDADYNSLPSGTLFLAPDGTTRRKP